MTNRYVRSGGDAGTWTGTVATLTAGLAAPTVAGDDIYIASDHVEPVASSAITYTALGTGVAPNRIFVAPTSSSFPPVAANLVHTPTVTISSTGVASNITFVGVVSHCEGIIFSAGAAANQANIHFTGNWYLKNCSVILNNTSGSSSIRSTGALTSKTVWDNVTVQFGAIAQSMNPQGGEFIWKNTLNAIAAAGSIPTALFSTGAAGISTLRGVDLSGLTPSKTLCAASASIFSLTLINCKEPATWTRVAAQAGDFVTVVGERSDSGALNYTKVKDDFSGTQTVETTIVRTGGATDATTPNSWKIDAATKAKVKPDKPFKSTPIVIWNDVVGSNRTVTVYGVASALPNNNDIWLEVDYLGSSATPIGTVATTTVATPLTTPAAVATDASTWGAGAPSTKFRLVLTLDNTTWPRPAMKGPFTIRVCVGAQALYYIDWQPVLS